MLLIVTVSATFVCTIGAAGPALVSIAVSGVSCYFCWRCCAWAMALLHAVAISSANMSAPVVDSVVRSDPL